MFVPVPRQPRDPSPGDRVGRYTIQERLGSGAMGVVCAAIDERLGRRVALKFLAGDTGSARHQQVRNDRLLREAQALARLSHPNIVTVFDVGSLAGRVFMAMELIDGLTVRDWLRLRPREPEEVLGIFILAGRGLAAAHRQGLIHRDVKPENIMVDLEGRVAVTDFGVVGTSTPPEVDAPFFIERDAEAERERDDHALDPPRSVLTRPGAVPGTPAYMAPEHRLGLSVTPQSDQYSFCASLFEALIGVIPAGESDAHQLYLESDGGDLGSGSRHPLPKTIAAVVAHGLAANPDLRFPDMDALVEALTTELARFQRRQQRWRMRLTLATGAVAFAGLASWGLFNLPSPCKSGEQAVEAMWSGPQRLQIESKVQSSATPHAQDTWSLLKNKLAAYANRWQHEYEQACEATMVRHEQSTELMDRRMACLRTQLVHVRASLELLSRGQSETLALRMHETDDALDQLEDCTDEQRLLDGQPPPSNNIVAEVEELESSLAQIRALNTAGEYEHALGQARYTLRRARHLGYAPVITAATYAAGTLHSKLEDYPSSVPLLEESFALAYAIGADRIAVDAKIALLVVTGLLQSEFERGMAHASTARAGLVRLGGDPRRRAQLESGIAAINAARGELDAAEDGYRRVLALQEQYAGPEHLEVAYTLGNLGVLLQERGYNDEALQLLRRQLSILDKIVGKNHPTFGRANADLGTALAAVGQHMAARNHFQRALRIYARSSSSLPSYEGNVWAKLGTLALSQNEPEQAESMLTRALERLLQTASGPDPTLAAIKIDLAQALLQTTKFDRALEKIDSAITDLESIFGTVGPQLSGALVLRGEIQLARGQLAEACENVRRVLALNEPLSRKKTNHVERSSSLRHTCSQRSSL